MRIAAKQRPLPRTSHKFCIKSKIKPVQVSDFNFHLPEELIAQKPPEDRAGARMLTLNRETGAHADHHFREFPEMLRAGDVLILNNSRVIPARLYAHRAGLHTQRSLKPGPDKGGRVGLAASIDLTQAVSLTMSETALRSYGTSDAQRGPQSPGLAADLE